MAGVRIGGVAMIPNFFYYQKEFFDSGTSDDWQQIWRVPLAGGAAEAVTTVNTNGDIDSDPVPSPDQSKVVFLRATGFGSTFLYIMNPDGSGITALDNTIDCNGPKWRPDGQKIVYRTSTPAIVTINPDGTGKTTVVAKSNCRYPVYSPDGTQIAYIVTSGGSVGLWVVDENGSNDTRIDSTSGPQARVAWLHGSDVIVYSFTPSSTGQAFTINADGTGKTDITSGNIGPFFNAWCVSADDTLAFTPETNGASPWTCKKVPTNASGESSLATSQDMFASVGRGEPFVYGNRIYTIRSSNQDLVSFALDGSDIRVEDVNVGGVNSETLLLTSNGSEG